MQTTKLTENAVQTPKQRQAKQILESLRRLVDDIAPTATEREIDDRLAELEDAELIARLAGSAAWRA